MIHQLERLYQGRPTVDEAALQEAKEGAAQLVQLVDGVVG